MCSSDLQEAALKKVIAELKDTKGALMPIMQQAQEIYGYLPIEVQTMISDETGIPLEKIYGVSTFYSQFALQPKGKYQISVCLGTACYVKGSGAIFSKLEEILGITNGECTPDGRFSLDSCRCVGACGLAPVMMINEEVYGRLPRHLSQISIAMMPEISLNVLDVAENSTRAGASLVNITVKADFLNDQLTIIIDDNGCGMTPQQVEQVTDPFFTSRTTRKVGLGVPFFKLAAESTGGSFTIISQPNVGTKVTAVFILSHIDRMPLGDINTTIHTLVVYHPETDFVYRYQYNNRSFTLDTREFRQVLGDIPFDTPEISAYIMDYLNENKQETDGGASY